MKIYRVYRYLDGSVAATVERDPSGLIRSVVTHIPIHSPDGFEFGYGGSGPADLALAILADFLGASTDPNTYKGFAVDLKGPARTAWRHHQAFKRDFVAPAEEVGFSVTSDEIEEWLYNAIKEDQRRNT